MCCTGPEQQTTAVPGPSSRTEMVDFQRQQIDWAASKWSEMTSNRFFFVFFVFFRKIFIGANVTHSIDMRGTGLEHLRLTVNSQNFVTQYTLFKKKNCQRSL
jgi:hypothetical protein